MSGGGEPTWSVDDVKPPKPPVWAYDPSLPSFAQPAYDSDKLDEYYRMESMKDALKRQDATPEQQMAEATRLIMRESSQGRIPDPDYDLTPRDRGVYANLDLSALAAQRARDYADDLEQELKARGEEYTKAQRDRIVADKQDAELKKLNALTATDDDRAKSRDDRRMRLLLGKVKLKPGTSILSDEQTGSGNSLLTE